MMKLPKHSVPIRRGKQADLPLRVAIIGGGRACCDLLELLDSDRRSRLRMEIIGVADINPDSPGLECARRLGLFTTTRGEDLFGLEGLNLIIEPTGSSRVLDEISRNKPPGASVLDHKAARLLWDLIQVDTAVECMKKGAYDFITKPFQVDPFLITVRRAADKRRLEEQARRLREENEKNLYDLHLEKSRLRTIVQCMGNGVMVCTRRLEMVFHNPALMRLLEIPGEFEGPVSIRGMVGERTLCDTLQKMLNTPGAAETVIQEAVAGKKTLRAISAPLFGPEQEVTGAVTVLEDITPFKQLDRMKSDFVHMVAHELRSPLVSIRQLNSVILKFYRVKHPKTRQVAGSGLGLAIVKGVVEAHHGSIEVQSVPEKGTTFRILLPAFREDP